jgi:hypothetical protein
MLDKLVQLLGEELANKVTEALGEVELAIMNDGTVVKATKLDSLKAEHNALQEKYTTDISGINSKLEAATTNAADFEGLKGTIETMKADNLKIADEHRIALANVKKNSTIESALRDANVNQKYLEMVKSQLNTDSLQFEGDNLIGLTDRIATAVESFPDLFGTVKSTGTPPDPNLTPPPTGKRQQKIKDYNEAEKNRDFKSMARLKNEIESLKD